MMKISFEDKDNTLALTVKGHAGYADTGQDIVCAAATILAYTVAQAVKDMYGQGRLEKEPYISLKEGNATVRCAPKAETYAEALHTYFVAQIGYNLLSHNYPDNIKLKMFGQAEKP